MPGSWLGKMQAVRQVLVEEPASRRPELDALAYAYIYLQVSPPLEAQSFVLQSLRLLCSHQNAGGACGWTEQACWPLLVGFGWDDVSCMREIERSNELMSDDYGEDDVLDGG